MNGIVIRITAVIDGKFSSISPLYHAKISMLTDIMGQKWKIWHRTFHFWLIYSVGMETKAKFRPDFRPRRMDAVRQFLQYPYYGYKKEQADTDWIFRCVRFHGAKPPPKNMGKVQN